MFNIANITLSKPKSIQLTSPCCNPMSSSQTKDTKSTSFLTCVRNEVDLVPYVEVSEFNFMYQKSNARFWKSVHITACMSAKCAELII